LKESFQLSLTRQYFMVMMIPALKGRAKFNRRYAACERHILQIGDES